MAGLVCSPTAARARGVAAKHASLSRWRSPVRIRSGPPVPQYLCGVGTRPAMANVTEMSRVAILGLTLLLAVSATGCQAPGTISTGSDGLRTFATYPNV